ncbi:MAG TPA: GNAT family protein [Flavipsychrobacter sp.]|nr:GNAT family protein [Flavipsychrobacter sp.]
MLQVDFMPFSNLTTEHLVLRRPDIRDAKNMFALRTDKNVNKYLDRPLPDSIEEVALFIDKLNKGIDENTALYWIITLKDTTELIGTICYWNISKENHTAETGFELIPAFQGKGIMREALSKVIEFGFNTLHFHSITAWTHKDNYPSQKLLETNHFIRDTDLEAENEGNEELADTVIYSLANTAYVNKQ